MKKILQAGVFALSLGMMGLASAHTVIFENFLTGPDEFPANPSLGIGFGRVTIDLDLLTMRVQAVFAGLTGNVSAAHVHCCVSPDAVSPLAGVATITPTFTGFPTGVTSGSYDFTYNMGLATSYNDAFVTANGGVSGAFDALIAGLIAGEAYFNIHTSTSPGGEIRGFLQQIAPVPVPAAAWLLGSAIAALGVTRRKRRAA